jgi:predicted phage terminase large subunit-like protein
MSLPHAARHEESDRRSFADRLADLPRPERRRMLGALSQAEAEGLLKDWSFRARPEQLAPSGEWVWWLILAGRGFGKTRSGAEWVRANVGRYGRWHLVGPTAADVRDVMIEGESGILAISPNDERPLFEPSKRRLRWPNGARATLFSADEPERLRGPQCEAAWADEISAWRYPEAWDQLQFGMRLGTSPRGVATTTPKPVRVVKELLASASTVLTRGTSYDNAENLAPTFLEKIVGRYEGTRLGDQELRGILLEEFEGAFWNRDMIDRARVKKAPDLRRVVVAIDPATTAGEDSDQTGLAVCGRGLDGALYVLGIEGVRLSPRGWATRALEHFDTHGADRLIAERNNGGEMVEATLHSVRPGAPVTTIHASRGKTVRAEPIAALYEQCKVHHVGIFTEAEEQMCGFPVSDEHDDMVDALVYALTELAECGPPAAGGSIEPGTVREERGQRSRIFGWPPRSSWSST